MSESDVRRDILNAASKLFATQGYKSTSVREVVAAAGVTKPTMYYWFQNKEALFREVVQNHLANLRALMTEELEAPGTARERIERYSRRFIAAALSKPEVVHLMMLAMHPIDHEQPSLDLLEWHHSGIEMLATVLNDGVAGGEIRPNLHLPTAAAAWLGMVNHALMGFIHGAPFNESAVDHLLDLYFDGVSPR